MRECLEIISRISKKICRKVAVKNYELLHFCKCILPDLAARRMSSKQSARAAANLVRCNPRTRGLSISKNPDQQNVPFRLSLWEARWNDQVQDDDDQFS